MINEPIISIIIAICCLCIFCRSAYSTLKIFSSSTQNHFEKNLTRRDPLPGNSQARDREEEKGSLHDHLLSGEQGVADELASPQGNGSVGHDCGECGLTRKLNHQRRESASEKRSRNSTGTRGLGGLSKSLLSLPGFA
jgi:hypothetical protein